MLKAFTTIVFLAFVMAMAPDAFASMTSSGLPTDTGFRTLQNFITGEYAYIATVVGGIGAGVAFYYSQESSGFIKTLLQLVCVMCFVLGAVTIISVITGKGALIA